MDQVAGGAPAAVVDYDDTFLYQHLQLLSGGLELMLFPAQIVVGLLACLLDLQRFCYDLLDLRISREKPEEILAPLHPSGHE